MSSTLMTWQHHTHQFSGSDAGIIPQGYRGFNWYNAAVTANPDITPGCINGLATGIVTQPNILVPNQAEPVYMTILPGFVFGITSLKATVFTASTAVATFTGYDKDGTPKGTVTASVKVEGPTNINLSSLGRISTLEITTSSCDLGTTSCGSNNYCFGGFAGIAIDNIAVAGECCYCKKVCQGHYCCMCDSRC
jgi:hypothetical protein